MKVFFSMSFRGDVAVGYSIVKHLIAFGHKVTNDSFTDSKSNVPREFYGWSLDQRLAHYRALFKALRESDIVIVESSIQSLSIGQMIQEAIELRKPTLILVSKGISLTYLDLLTEKEDRLIKMEYTLDNIEARVKEGLDYLTQQVGVRFTLILPPDIIQHLDLVSKSGMSRSTYIRNLISADMVK